MYAYGSQQNGHSEQYRTFYHTSAVFDARPEIETARAYLDAVAQLPQQPANGYNLAQIEQAEKIIADAGQMSETHLISRFVATLALVVVALSVFALFVRVHTGSTTVVSYDPFGPCVVHVQVSPFVHLVSHCD